MSSNAPKNKHLSKYPQIEHWIRKKNNVYLKWRVQWDQDQIDDWCSECMLRFGVLPRWEEWVQARRRQDWHITQVIQKEHSHWKSEVRQWCMEAGITTYPNQSSQFVKYYFAWYRWQWEERHGAITRTYGRQMS